MVAGSEAGCRPVASAAMAALILCVSMSCVGPGERLEEHPTAEGLVREGAPSQILSFFAPSESQAPSLPALSENTWTSRAPVRTLGVLAAPEEEVFGAIEAVSGTSDGALFILDPQARMVRPFDRDGNPLSGIGGYGSGPGEFLAPRAMLTLPQGPLLVGDYTGNVSVLDIEGESVRFSHFIRHGGDLWDMCVLGEDLLVHGMAPASDHTIHVYTMDGDPVHSFAAVYRTENRIVQHQLSRGRIACLEEPGLVLLAPMNLPEVRAYDADGTLLWWIELGDFRAVPLFGTPVGGSRMRFPEEGWHTTLGLVASTTVDAALLQVARLTPDTPRPSEAFSDLHTFLIFADGRRARYLGEGWPRIMRWDGDRLYGVSTAPHPQLMILPVGR